MSLFCDWQTKQLFQCLIRFLLLLCKMTYHLKHLPKITGKFFLYCVQVNYQLLALSHLTAANLQTTLTKTALPPLTSIWYFSLTSGETCLCFQTLLLDLSFINMRSPQSNMFSKTPFWAPCYRVVLIYYSTPIYHCTCCNWRRRISKAPKCLGSLILKVKYSWDISGERKVIECCKVLFQHLSK